MNKINKRVGVDCITSLEEGLSLIISHFEEPVWPRTISIQNTNDGQVLGWAISIQNTNDKHGKDGKDGKGLVMKAI